jgi:SAM-dependent methyltransferase
MRRLDATAIVDDDEPLATLRAAVQEALPTSVLDAGSGDGEIASIVAGPNVICVDRSAAAVEAARSRGLEAHGAAMEELPFPDESFDVVMSNWTLYHLADLDRGLAEIARVLRPGGRFVGAYNRDGHLEELWAAVRYEPPQASFDGEHGAGALRRHFASVERRDTDGTVEWPTREALQTYLDAYAELAGALVAPADAYPFRASRRNCIFVAQH